MRSHGSFDESYAGSRVLLRFNLERGSGNLVLEHWETGARLNPFACFESLLEAMSLERLCHHECHEAGVQDVRSQFLEFDASLAG